MKRFLQKLPQAANDAETRHLLQEKVKHYEKIAADLMADDASTMPNLQDSLRSPATCEGFFSSESSIVPLPPPTMDPLSPRSSPSKADHSHVTSTVGHANQKLARALDLDEAGKIVQAKEIYMEAASGFLEALKVTEKNSKFQAVSGIIKRRLETTLGRVEDIERLEKSKGKILPQRRDKQEKPDASALTAREIEILKQSSLIATGVFLPWSELDAKDLLLQMRHGKQKLYTDPAGFLPLSDSQQKHIWKWARPSEIMKIRNARNPPVMIKAITPYTIQQKYVTDCSFVASLCICAAFERRFQKRLITSVIYPQSDDGTVLYNPAGKYMVKLWFNGVARCVVIDDYLPIDRYGNLLCSSTSGQDLELWVCLIEKAFLKLSGGGYGFPGSNSGVDMFALTGWIPESIIFAKDPTKVKDFETAPERAWERIYSASSYGDCLITVSSNLDGIDEDAIGIVTGHAYAVLSVIETKNGTRLLQLKNPWAHRGWKGRFSSRDTASWSDPRFCAEVGYNQAVASRQKDDGVFWICWQDVLRYFQNFHLSWNPALFPQRTTLHDLWPVEQGPAQDTFNIGENPQYVMELSDKAIAQNASIWILLSRHVNKEEQIEGQVRLNIRRSGRMESQDLLSHLRLV